MKIKNNKLILHKKDLKAKNLKLRLSFLKEEPIYEIYLNKKGLVHITEGKITLKDINELVSKLT